MSEEWNERTKKVSCVCVVTACCCLLCVHIHLVGERVENFGKHYYLLLNCVYWMVWIAIAQSFTHYALCAFNFSIRIDSAAPLVSIRIG